MFRVSAHRRVAGVLGLAGALAAASLIGGPAQAVTRSHLWDWGPGPLGLGKIANRVNPVPVHGLGAAPVRQVIRSNGTVLVLLTDGTVWAWGGGPLGNGGGPSTSSLSPVQVTALSGVTAIAATSLDTGEPGSEAFYALRSDGTVWAWGNGADGQLGNGSTVSQNSPVQVTGLTGVTRIAASADTAYALTSAGRAWAWGGGADGELGNGAIGNSDVPVRVGVADRVIQLSAACGTAYAITGGRRVFAWGANSHGQLGDGSRSNAATPVLVRRVSHALTVTAGCVNAYAIIQGSRMVLAWGAGAQGEMGDGHTATRLYPVTVTGLNGIQSVFSAYYTAYAVDSAGKVWAWGYGRQGNLGNGQYANSAVPVQVINISVPVTAVVAGQSPPPGNAVFGGVNTIVARGSDGSLWSWGYTGFGSAGGGGAGASPGRIPRIPPVTSVFGTWFGAV